MMLANGVSHYHVCTAAIRGASLVNERIAIVSANWIGEYKHRATKAKEYALEHGQGMLRVLRAFAFCLWVSRVRPFFFTGAVVFFFFRSRGYV